MSAAVQIIEPEAEVRAAMRAIGAEARLAARKLANAPAEKKNQALMAAARALRARSAEILAANARDLADAEAKRLSAALVDRLALNTGASRLWPAASRRSPPARSGRARARDLHAAERPYHRARGDAARRRRRHL